MKTKQMDEQLTEFFDFTEGYLEDTLTSIRAKLQKQFPEADDYWLEYWASRIAFFTHCDADTFQLTMDPTEGVDPTEITLTFNPSYGS
jgi:hypothetical protein